MPLACRQTINDWFKKHPETPYDSFACAITTSVSTVFHTDSAKKDVVWKNSDDIDLKVATYSLNGTLLQNGRHDKSIVVVWGRNMFPSIVSNGSLAWSGARSAAYKQGVMPAKIWVGIGGDQNGWEDGNTVFKCQKDHDDIAEQENPLGVGGIEHDTHEQYFQGRGVIRNVSRRPIASNHDMPMQCRNAINDWFTENPDVDYGDLPCATKSDKTTVKRTRSGRPLRWIHKNGIPLEVSMYSLHGTDVCSDGRDRKVVVISGSNLAPTIVSNGRFLNKPSSAQYTDGRLPVKVWLGVSGDADGWERDYSVFKCVKAKTSLLNADEQGLTQDSSDDREDLICSIPSSHEMPKTCRETINIWFRNNPRVDFATLQCTTSTRPSNIYTTDDQSKFISWRLAATKEKLKVSTYFVINAAERDEAPYEYSRRRITVVSGRHHPPTIVSNGHSGFSESGRRSVRVWIGVDGDKNGWSKEDLVYQSLEMEAPEGYLQEDWLQPKDHEEQFAQEDFAPHEPQARESLTACEDAIPHQNPLPTRCRNIINDWFRQNPDLSCSAFPCTMSSSKSKISSTHAGKPLRWLRSDTGEELQLEVYSVANTKLDTGSKFSKIIVVQGENTPPTIIPNTSKSPANEHGFKPIKAWIGTQGDVDGFEDGNSIYKCLVDCKFTPDDVLEPDGEDYPFADDVGKESRRKRNLAQQQVHKAVIEQSTRSTRTTTTKAEATMRLEELQPHLLDNVVCLFFSATTGLSPRFRLFNACDTVQKLFAQAVAGDLFPDTNVKSGSRVLSIRPGGLTKIMAVAEDDQEDFDDVLEFLPKTGWFTKAEGIIHGSGTIEVRAMM